MSTHFANVKVYFHAYMNFGTAEKFVNKREYGAWESVKTYVTVEFTWKMIHFSE